MKQSPASVYFDLSDQRPISRTAKKNPGKKFACCLFLILFIYLLPDGLRAQPLGSSPVLNNLLLNTGVNSSGGQQTSSLPTGEVNWSVTIGSPVNAYSLAVVINTPNIPSGSCLQWSANMNIGPWSKWITVPAFTCGGMWGNYTCNTVTDLYFKREFFLPANTVFQANMSIWASDWVQDITVNSGIAYNSNVVGAPYPTHRQNGMKFYWCKWNYGQVNTVIVHVRVQPGMNPLCQVAGMKVEAYQGVYINSISGPANICPNTTNLYSMPTSTSMGLPPLSYTWNRPLTWTGTSTTYSANLTASTLSGTMSAMMYSVSSTGTTCLAIGGYNVNVSPPLPITPSATLICSGYPLVLTASGASSYVWTAPNGNVVGGAATATVFPSQTGVYTVTGPSSVTGCVVTGTVFITVLPIAFVGAMSSPSVPVCSGQPVTLTAYGTAVSYTWTRPPGITTTVNPLAVTPSVTTTYTASGTNTNGCVATRTITVVALPIPTLVVASNPSVICQGQSSTLTVSGASTYTWAPMPINTSTALVSPAVTATYAVTGTGTNGCIRTGSTSVTVLNVPVVTITPPFSCPGITNTMTAAGATNYTWYIGSPPTLSVSNASTLIPSPGTFTFTICGSGTTGCVACVSVALVPGQPVPIVATNTVLCTNAASCVPITATSTMGAVSYTWNTSPPTVGPMALVCPTIATVYSVSATSSLGCANTVSMAVTMATNCCSQSTAGLTVMTNFTGTLTNTAFLLNNAITVTGASRLQDCEIWATPDVQITVLPGATLDLDHVHMFACGLKMWHGILIQDGGRITTDYAASRMRSSMIEDASVAIELSNISVANSGVGTPPIEIQRMIFNRNYIGIRIKDSDPALTSLPLGITGCVFSSRNMPSSTFPSTIANNSWASAEVIPGTFWGNNPGLKVPGALTPTTGLEPPYQLNMFPQANLKIPYANQPGHIGIKIQNIGDPNGFAVDPGVDIGYTYPGYISQDFNLFDGLGNGIDITDASVTLAENVFQNSQMYTSVGWPGVFGGHGIRASTMGLMNTLLNLTKYYDTGNRFWNCMTAISATNICEFSVRDAFFRSNHTASTALLPDMPGDIGILYNTNRYNFSVVDCQFNNVKRGIIFNPAHDGVGYVTTYGMGPIYGIFAYNLKINQNYFGPQVLSSTPINWASPASPYMSDAIQLNTQVSPYGFANWWGTANVNSNRMDRVFRGVLINSMEYSYLAVAGNSIYVADDNVFGSPALGYGIAAYNDARNVSISSNTLEAMSSLGNYVSLVYCKNTQGPRINCNRVSNSNYGFEFVGNNMGTEWEGNTMCTNFYGLALTSNGIIGQQGTPTAPSDNYWDCGQWGTGNAPNQTWCDASNPSASPLYVNSGTNYNPTYNFAGPFTTPYSGTSIFPTGVNNPTLNCSGSYPSVPGWRMSAESSLVSETAVFSNGSGVSIFPNPTSGKLTIRYLDQSENMTVTVMDLTGKIVLAENMISNSETTLDLTGLPPSVYLVELKGSNTKALRYKVVKMN